MQKMGKQPWADGAWPTMFDPYHKWLAIPPDLRPPTHYQLLGVSPQEQDPEVIQEAALRQTSHVRMYQIGTHAAECTRLLNEIAQARTTLLNPAKRKEYDSQFATGSAAATPGPARDEPREPLSLAPTFPPKESNPVVAPLPVRGRRAPVPGRRAGYAIAIAIAVAIWAVPTYFLLLRGPSSDDTDDIIAEQQNDGAAGSSRETEKEKPSPAKPAVPLPSPLKRPESPPRRPQDDASGGTAGSEDPRESVNPATPRPSRELPVAPPSRPTQEVQVPAVKKAPVPSGAAQSIAEKQIKDIFKAEYARIRPVDRLTLAAELLQKAEETDDDIVGRFVLFREARDLAASAGDVVAALTVVDRMADQYAVAKVELKVRAVEASLEGARTPTEFRTVAEAALELAQEQLEAEQLEAAQRLLSHAAIAAHKADNGPLLKQVRGRAKEVDAYQAQGASARDAAAILDRNPRDAKANLALGKYLCFWKGSWTEGLPHLALGSDRGLQALARDDLADPQDSTTQAKLGHDWFQLASHQEDGRPRVQITRRAQRWYNEALPGLSGLSRTQIERRLQEVDEVTPSRGTDIPGQSHRVTGHKGNVTGVALSRDGHLALSGSADGTIRLWNVDTGKEIRQLGPVSGPVTAVAFSPDGKEIAAGTGSGTAARWDAAGGAILKTYDLIEGEKVTSVAYSPKGDYLLLGGAKGCLRAWPLRESLPSWDLPSRPALGVLRNVGLSPDDRSIVFTDGKGKVHLCDWKTRRLRALPFQNDVLSVGFVPGGRSLATGAVDKTVRLWDPLATTWRLRTSMRGHTQAVTCLAFSADGRRILSGSEDRSVRLWDTKNGRLLQSFLWHTGKITSVAISGDGRLGLSGSEDKTVRVWRLPP
jgi:WD40 repeat protein